MKYIKTYENIISRLFPRHKLANSLVKFLNKIEPSLKCYIKVTEHGINIASKKCDKKSGYLITIEEKKYKRHEFGSDEPCLDIILHHIHDGLEIIFEFLRDLFHTDHAIANIDPTYVDSYIEKLTEENYKNFILKIDTKKYNI